MAPTLLIESALAVFKARMRSMLMAISGTTPERQLLSETTPPRIALDGFLSPTQIFKVSGPDLLQRAAK